jgi:hypothetical protein
MMEREGLHAVIDTLDFLVSGGTARRRAALNSGRAGSAVIR